MRKRRRRREDARDRGPCGADDERHRHEQDRAELLLRVEHARADRCFFCADDPCDLGGGTLFDLAEDERVALFRRQLFERTRERLGEPRRVAASLS